LKINNLKINGFGKLENKEINLANNINLIYGENEAGKTTLLKFISGMFYGTSKNKNKKEFSDFERYMPWNAKEFSGKIKYELDNKEEFEVFRDFTKKNPQIYNKNGEDISKHFNIDKTKGNEFFYEQTKIDEQTFFATTLIKQKDVVLDNSKQAALTQKIANILSTGEENVSFKKTNEKLNKKLIEEVGTERTIGRPLNIVCDKIKKIQEEQKEMAESSNLKNELEEKILKIKNKIKEKEIKLNLIKEIKKIKENNNLENEKIKINNNLKEEEEIKIKKIEEKLNENKNEIEEKNSINIIIFIILFLLNIILFIFRINKIVNIAFVAVTFVFTAFTIFKTIKNNQKIRLNNKDQKQHLNEIKIIKNNIEKIEENINNIKNKKNEEEEIEKNKIKESFVKKINQEEIEFLFSVDINEINNILDEIEKEISSLKLQQYTNEIDFNNLIKKEEEKVKTKEILEGLIEEKEEVLKLEKSINITKEALERAYKKMKEEITPKFTRNLSEIVKKISNGKYKKTNYIDEEGLIVELENGEYVNSNRLSVGTIDQLYLSLRLSAMQEITEEKMPIILDETFAYYDNERLKNILIYLNKELSDYQIMIFTCSNREKEILDEIGIKYNYINLHN